MKRVQIYLSKSQTKKVQELLGKEEFTGLDIVGVLMKIENMDYVEFVSVFKKMAEVIKDYKPKG